MLETFPFLTDMMMGKPLWMWLSFAVVVVSLLVLDLGVLNRKDHEISLKESMLFSSFCISLGLLFGLFVYHEMGQASALAYWTGFIIEETLSIDNIFVIAMLFTFFKVPRIYQHRVLFWGILGAVLLRGLMIGLGAALVSEFEWILYIFALFLIFTGVKMLFVKDDDEKDLAHNPLLLFMQKHFRVTKKIDSHDFFVRKNGKLYLTPLFLALVMIEFADVIFAVDSVPAIFIITKDPFIVYTSNIFAILGLRALYFVLAAIIERFHYLKYALSLVLIFIGSKTFIADFMGWEKFPIGWSLGVTFALLGGGVVFSLLRTAPHETKS